MRTGGIVCAVYLVAQQSAKGYTRQSISSALAINFNPKDVVYTHEKLCFSQLFAAVQIQREAVSQQYSSIKIYLIETNGAIAL